MFQWREAANSGWLTGSPRETRGLRDTHEPSLAFLCPLLDLLKAHFSTAPSTLASGTGGHSITAFSKVGGTSPFHTGAWLFLGCTGGRRETPKGGSFLLE